MGSVISSAPIRVRCSFLELQSSCTAPNLSASHTLIFRALSLTSLTANLLSPIQEPISSLQTAKQPHNPSTPNMSAHHTFAPDGRPCEMLCPSTPARAPGRYGQTRNHTPGALHSCANPKRGSDCPCVLPPTRSALSLPSGRCTQSLRKASAAQPNSEPRHSGRPGTCPTT